MILQNEKKTFKIHNQSNLTFHTSSHSFAKRYK